ncbi:MAG: hypothetical protein WC671_02265 [Candidatus Paceibacterota bacterium]|jgi:hypothetical protein
MEQNFQTSFIPKKPIIKEESIDSARSISIFFIISLFIFFTVLVATGGLYFYERILVKKITGMGDTLNLAKNRFEPSKITELQTFDKRLISSSEILSKHITIIPIFNALEQLTMKSVRFTDFSYSLGADIKNKINIKMSGIAIGYRSIALQSDLFEKNKNLIDPIFSNLTLDNDGNVIFNLEFSVDPSFVNYKQALMIKS